MGAANGLRVALADYIDPVDMERGSGASASLLASLGEVVGEVVPLSAELPDALARAARYASYVARVRPRDLRHPRAGARNMYAAAQLGRPAVRARSLLLGRRLAAAGTLDGVVQRGSEIHLPAATRIVTYEDSTVLQAWRSYRWPHLQGLSEREIGRFAARQRRTYQAAVACCCATHWVASDIVQSYGIAHERVFTVGVGQNHELSPPPSRDWSTPRYLFVGFNWERKNGEAVRHAFARVRDSVPEAQLDVVGRHAPISQAGVIDHGPLSLADPEQRRLLEALYRSATVFLLPSLHEPAGIAYAEAASAGLPSIGTSNGGAATIIGPGGLVVEPHDSDAIVDAMLTLADPKTARSLGELALRHSQRFTWRMVAERIVRALAPADLDTSNLATFL